MNIKKQIKRTGLLALFLASGVALSAQNSAANQEFKGIAKGNGLIGITPGVMFNQNDNISTSYRLTNSLTGGYFVSNNFMIGLHANQTYNYSKVSLSTSFFSLNSGITLRYYKFFTDRFGFFLNSSLSYTYFTANPGSTGHGGMVDISPNFVYKAGKCLMLEAGMGGLNFSYLNSGGNHNIDANLWFINSIKFGVAWKLGNK